jgi:hypothetical protein
LTGPKGRRARARARARPESKDTQVSKGAVAARQAIVFISLAALASCSDDGAPQTESASGPGLATSGLPPASTGETAADDDTAGAKLDLGAAMDVPAVDTDAECAAQTIDPEVMSQPVDVLVVVDTSTSMGDAIASVETSINADFAAILEASGVDYRVIVAGDYPPGAQLDICITMPLSATDCNPPPAVPAVTERYKHYDAITGSGTFLQNIVTWATAPDPHGLAPGGYVDFFRDGSRKVILAMTDGESASGSAADGDAFDAQLLAFNPAVFGTPADRQYVFHAIVSMPVNNPPEAAWLPADPIAGEGGSIQQVAVLTGGWRFPLSQPQHFGTLFEEIATVVVESTPVACEFPIPEPPAGETIDPDTIEIDYSPGGVPPVQPFHQVTGPAACEPDAFYIDSGLVFLCPEACALVQGDAMAHLDVRYGCDVGFDPAG